MPPRSVYNVALRRFHLCKRIFAYGERYLLRKPIGPCGIRPIQAAPKYAELRAGQYELFIVCAYLFYLKAVFKGAVLYDKRIQPFAAEAIASQISVCVYDKVEPLVQRLISFGRSSFFYVVAAGVQSGEKRHARLVRRDLLYLRVIRLVQREYRSLEPRSVRALLQHGNALFMGQVFNGQLQRLIVQIRPHAEPYIFQRHIIGRRVILPQDIAPHRQADYLGISRRYGCNIAVLGIGIHRAFLFKLYGPLPFRA